jgi:hypothetical protein
VRRRHCPSHATGGSLGERLPPLRALGVTHVVCDRHVLKARATGTCASGCSARR